MIQTRIDLGAIAHNTRVVKERLRPGTQLMAVVKADGYNHGAVSVARVMVENGADALGVATLPEALELRRAGIEVPVLAWMWTPHIPSEVMAHVLSNNIAVGVASLAHAQAIAQVTQRGIPAEVYVKVETGMHRSGVDPEHWETVFSYLKNTPGVQVQGVFSHLSSADDPKNPATDLQATQFFRAIECGRAVGLELPINHLCNSPATMTRPDLHGDMVRVGVCLYGGQPVFQESFPVQPAMSWLSEVVMVKPIAQGEATSYGLTWAAQRAGYLAVVPVGYADGLPRSAQGVLEVAIKGRRYPQVGRVCMDQFLVDLGENPDQITTGDEVCLFGSLPGALSPSELAQRLGTIDYELFCRPTGRTEREYVPSGMVKSVSDER
ncbi:alanine racemase [Corynebacterium poyangense]|uniref:alanine racemase n=1 Tax=Corynebacterium poyangense TaxID=2684405 RepID=UPI001CC9E5B5|nr:alanine racemase [Corynebacterium poyangense]